jgi:tRNA (uracil-5-)-methyltransferase TRM9
MVVHRSAPGFARRCPAVYNQGVDQSITQKLLSLNREFYGMLAKAFDSSRSVWDPAVTCILPYVPAAAKVLDVGCGNGRLAQLLDSERSGGSYLGIDSSPELIAIARRHAVGLRSTCAEFVVGDVTRPGWLPDAGRDGFECVVALAVLHHIPSRELRLGLLGDLSMLVSRSGRIILSTWQFLDSDRLRRKIVPWDEVGLADDQVEPGDYLLDWRRGGPGLRYCHQVDEDEVRGLALASGLTVANIMRAGGREGTLSLVAVLEPADRPDGGRDHIAATRLDGW